MKFICYLKCPLLILTFCVLMVLSVDAQQTISAASLSGRVEDPAGAVIPSAKVTAKNTGTNQFQNAVTDENGRFRFAYLPVGDYEISCEMEGYTPKMQKMTATVGQAMEVVFQLTVGPVSAQVDVNSDNMVIVETARTQVAETILPRDVAQLPLNGRNYIDLALLIPGVSRTNTGSVQRFAETSAVPGTGISVAGQRNLNNSFVVDGSSANDDAADLAGSYYSQEVIREFQVVTSGAVAEFGRATSGFINIITQSGTND